MVHCGRVSASSPLAVRDYELGVVRGSGTYASTPSFRCSIGLIEWSVRSSEEAARSEGGNKDELRGRKCELP